MTADESPSTAPETPKTGPDEALYLYALVSGTPEIDHAGMDESTPVQTLECAPWTAVIDAVPTDAWTGPAGEENMESLSWVAPRACRHEEVVEAAMATGPVYPARFGTLFSSADRLRETVASHEEVLADYFERVDGFEEWSIRGMLDRAAAQEHLAGSAADDDDEAPGTAYLKQRKREQEAQSDVDDWVDERADRLFGALEASVEGIRAVEPRPRPSDDGELVLHWAVLVPRGSDGGIQQYVASLAERHSGPGLELEASGPWPPYNFRPALDRDEPAGSSPS